MTGTVGDGTKSGERLAALKAQEAERKEKAAKKAGQFPALDEETERQLRRRVRRWERDPVRRKLFASRTLNYAALRLEREMKGLSGKEFRDCLKQFLAVTGLLAVAGQLDDDEKDDAE